MAILDICIYPDSVLRSRCEEVPQITPEISSILSDMAETMYDASGIGLAASQVGILQRLIVVDVGDDESAIDAQGNPLGLLKIINPVVRLADGSYEMEEGCLSIPDVRQKVRRMGHVIVDYLDEQGRKCSIEARGLLAVCLQHEIDHLNGVLFIDRLTPLRRELIRSKLKDLKKKNP